MDVMQEAVKIIAKQYKKKDLGFHKLTKQNLKELNALLKCLETHEIPPYFVKRKLPGNIGHGIFLHIDASPMKRGELIGPYGGEIVLSPQNVADEDENGDYTFDMVNDLILNKEEQKKFDRNRRYHPKRLYSLKVDALKWGTFTRYINHSATPNVEAHLVGTKDIPYQIFYFAKKKINPGEQLLVCYEGDDNSYWGALGIKPFPMDAKTFRLDSSLKLVKKKD